MALTLKQWADYLPHGVTVTKNDKYPGLLVGLLGKPWDLAEIKYQFGNQRDELLVLKPHLRPLSSLTKEIAVEEYNDGKPFVAKDVLGLTNGECEVLKSRSVDTAIKFLKKWQSDLLISWHFALDISEEDYIKIED